MRIDEYGECQICASQFKLPQGKLSMHGYTRPGYGYIVGGCWGSRELPYSVSRDAIPRTIEHLQSLIDLQEEKIERLSRGEYVGFGYVLTFDGFTAKVITTRKVDYDRLLSATEAENMPCRRFADIRAEAERIGADRLWAEDGSLWNEQNKLNRIGERLNGALTELQREIRHYQRRYEEWSPLKETA